MRKYYHYKAVPNAFRKTGMNYKISEHFGMLLQKEKKQVRESGAGKGASPGNWSNYLNTGTNYKPFLMHIPMLRESSAERHF